MHLTAPLPTLRRRHRRDDHKPTPQNADLQTQARAKRSGGPEDQALYSCGCGFAFKAAAVPFAVTRATVEWLRGDVTSAR